MKAEAMRRMAINELRRVYPFVGGQGISFSLAAVSVNKIASVSDPGTSKRLLVSCSLNLRTEIPSKQRAE